MGRAGRWLRGLIGGGKKPQPATDSGESPADPRPGAEKKKWGFGKSFREKGQPQPQPQLRRGAAAGFVDQRRGASYREGARPPSVLDDDEQSKRAIAVAAATAAVAEAAVAAAQAAAAVVKLTSNGWGTVGFGSAGTAVGKREDLAAVRIQSAFRGYLARRALKALKGLVKLQALVRGNIVRKQAAETLRCMQALVRVQARAQARRALQMERSRSETGFRTHAGPPTPENCEQAAHVGVTKSFRSGTLKRNASKSSAVDVVDKNRVNATGWNWLDRWMEERYWDSRGATKKAGIPPSVDDEKSAKILEVDPGKPQVNQKRRSNQYHSCSAMATDPNSHTFATVPDSPSKESTTAQQSVPSPSSIDMQQSTSTLRYPIETEGYSESPHFYSASSRPGSSRRGAFTPAKSEFSRSFFLGYSDYPNYMANTESFRAKVRSHSAPKQRPEFEKSSSTRRPSAHVYGQHAFAQRSSSLHAKFTNKAYPGSCRLDRLEVSTRC